MHNKYGDIELRVAVKDRLNKKISNSEDTYLVDELSVSRGNSRADLAVVNGRIEGIELKSAKDNLQRLQSQVHDYTNAFEKLSVYLDENHLNEAIEMLPEWCAVYSAKLGPRGGMKIRRIRQGKLNPDTTKVGLLCLLQRDELFALLSKAEKVKGMSSANYNELLKLAEKLPMSFIRETVRALLKIRIEFESFSGANVSVN